MCQNDLFPTYLASMNERVLFNTFSRSMVLTDLGYVSAHVKKLLSHSKTETVYT